MKISRIALSQNYYITPEDSYIVYDCRDEKKFSLRDVGTKIAIHKDQVENWFLDIGKKLKSDPEADYVILSIAISYIEGNQQYREGKSSGRSSEKFFIDGMTRIFDKQNIPIEILKAYYKRIRCGLFHDGMTRENVFISRDFMEPIRFNNGIILINVHQFFDYIHTDFINYINDITGNNKKMTKNFEKIFDIRYGI